MYADDLVIICNNKKKTFESIDIVKEWARDYKMKINLNKSGVMKCGKAKTKCPNSEKIRGIPIVQEYKYLGAVLKNDLRTDGHLTYIQRKI